MKRVIFGAIGVLVLAIIAWNIFGGKEDPVGTLSTLPSPSGLSTESSARNRELLELSTVLESISFDTNKGLFTSAAYTSLEDYNEVITTDPSQVGRPNPFSTIGVDVGQISAPTESGSGGDDLFGGSSESRIVTKSGPTHSGTQAVLSGELMSGSASVWFEWGTTQTALTNTTPITTMTAAGTFTKTISGLSTGTTYYYRAAARVSGLTVYGTVLSFVQ